MSLNKDLAFELQNVMVQLKKVNTLQQKHSKLKGAEKHILILLCELKNGQPVTISEIASKMGVTLAAVTHQINTLEKQNLIKRSSDGDDRRVVLIELTKKGEAQVIQLKKEFTKKIQIIAEFLGEKDTKDLIRVVKKMAEFPGFTK